MTERFQQKNMSVPVGMWIMRQTWNDVLFAHWPVDVSILRAMVPPVLELDTYNGQAWVSLLPFMLTNLRARFLPALPGARAFPELNFRTYVTYKGKPGIYFFSLDADHRLAVLGARTFFHLPYFYADMKAEKSGDGIDYVCRRNSIPRRIPAHFSSFYSGRGFSRLLADRTIQTLHHLSQQALFRRHSSSSLAAATCRGRVFRQYGG